MSQKLKPSFVQNEAAQTPHLKANKDLLLIKERSRNGDDRSLSKFAMSSCANTTASRLEKQLKPQAKLCQLS